MSFTSQTKGLRMNWCRFNQDCSLMYKTLCGMFCEIECQNVYHVTKLLQPVVVHSVFLLFMKSVIRNNELKKGRTQRMNTKRKRIQMKFVSCFSLRLN